MMASGQSPLDDPPSDVTGMLRRAAWQASAEICVFSWCVRGVSGVSTISGRGDLRRRVRVRGRGVKHFLSIPVRYSEGQ